MLALASSYLIQFDINPAGCGYIPDLFPVTSTVTTELSELLPQFSRPSELIASTKGEYPQQGGLAAGLDSKTDKKDFFFGESIYIVHYRVLSQEFLSYILKNLLG